MLEQLTVVLSFAGFSLPSLLSSFVFCRYLRSHSPWLSGWRRGFEIWASHLFPAIAYPRTRRGRVVSIEDLKTGRPGFDPSRGTTVIEECPLARQIS